MKRLFSPSDDEYIREHYLTTPYKELAKKFNVTERQMRGHINNIGLSKLNKVNCSFFHEIDSPSKAYWLGFLYADGWIDFNEDRRTYTVGVEVQSNDVSILIALALDMNMPCSIQSRNRHISFNGHSYDSHTSHVRFYSKALCEDLINLGVVPRKTDLPIYPQISNFQDCFIRGFLDGDGCIALTHNKSGDKYIQMVHFTNSNLEFLNFLSSIIEENCCVSGRIYKENDKKYRLYYSSLDSIRAVLNWIYSREDCPSLKRKYEIYSSYIGLAV